VKRFHEGESLSRGELEAINGLVEDYRGHFIVAVGRCIILKIN